jgi:hypothetical protein
MRLKEQIFLSTYLHNLYHHLCNLAYIGSRNFLQYLNTWHCHDKYPCFPGIRWYLKQVKSKIHFVLCFHYTVYPFAGNCSENNAGLLLCNQYMYFLPNTREIYIMGRGRS